MQARRAGNIEELRGLNSHNTISERFKWHTIPGLNIRGVNKSLTL
jgi:hypothetical protein